MSYSQITFTSQPFIVRSRHTTSTGADQVLLGTDDSGRNRRIYGMTINSTTTSNQIWVSGSFQGSSENYVPLFRTTIPSYSGYFDLASNPVAAFDLFGCDEANKIFQKKRDSDGNYYFDLPGDCSLVTNLTTPVVDGVISILTFGEV